MEEVVKVEHISKTFKIPHEKHTSLKGALLTIFQAKNYTKLKALQDVSFTINKGDFFGIVGSNGCGKSTLLKIIAGIYVPDKGKVEIKGALSPFLELGVGFNPELTARENVFLNGAILGLSKKEIQERFDEIISFAELEDFVDQKLKNFSSGMQVRLAFSVAIQAHAEVLLIDEVLAVGDQAFQQKCYDVFARLKKEGKTILFVSHGTDILRKFCNRGIYIKDGKIAAEGSINKVVDQYIYHSEATEKTVEQDPKNSVQGQKEVEIKKVSINQAGEKTDRIKPGPFEIVIDYVNNKAVAKAAFGVAIYDEFDAHLFGSSSKPLDLGKKGQIKLILDSPILDGRLYFTIAISKPNSSVTYNWHDKAYSVEVVNNKGSAGKFDFDAEWQVI